MTDSRRWLKDEYDVNFEDTSSFTVVRFNDIISTVEEELLEADCRTIRERRDWESVSAEIRRRHEDKKANAVTRKLVNQFHPVPRTLWDFAVEFERSIGTETVPMQILWGLLLLNIKLSCDSIEKLKKTTDWIVRLRRHVGQFNRCLEASAHTDNETNEARLAMIDVFDPLLSALAQSVNFLRSSPTDRDVQENWAAFDSLVGRHLEVIGDIVKHLNDMTNFSSINRNRILKNLEDRHTINPEPAESGSFPMDMLPHAPNSKFFGRQDELVKIDNALRPKPYETPRLRTYTIYGRRGVGKTELALQYAYSAIFAKTYDAVFWIGCETALVLRQSFTNMAIKLDLPRADMHGHHEENQMAVLKWLKQTRKTWLLVFDNAGKYSLVEVYLGNVNQSTEKEALLKGYIPKGVDGAILITSRKYYNFMKDDERKGDTVKLFSPEQSFDLLCQLLGENWKSLKDEKKMPISEINAARELLVRLTGLGLAIQQASVLIKNQNIGGSTIESTYELFKEHSARMPARLLGRRTDTYHELEALWDMNFGVLDANAKALLAVLALLSPDTTYIELFLPRKQTVLNGKLDFCKQLPNHVDAQSQATLTNVVQPTIALEKALEKLLRASLIRRDGRVVSVHREVQEAMNFRSAEELQEFFDAAVAIVNEAFPKRRHGIAMFEQWSVCSQYIHDGVHLAGKFKEYNAELTKPRLAGTQEFVQLVGNCAWLYLYEVSDYDGALDIIEIGFRACLKDMGESLLYADLCNTAGACYYEKNDLIRGRAAYERSFRIRNRDLRADDIEMAAILHNMGNLESAAGSFENAMALFNRAVVIRDRQGETAANQLALLYLCIGRNFFWQEQYDTAMKTYAKAENLFVRTLGADKHFMAHVHYAYGNVEFRRGNYLQARRSYNEGLRIAVVETPIHPITAAAYYSLGCVEFKLNNFEVAKSWLEKARAIAELRSPSRDDGTIARIIWRLSQVYREDVLTVAQANDLKSRAELALADLTEKGESTPPQLYDDDGNLIEITEQTLYNNLVPGFFR